MPLFKDVLPRHFPGVCRVDFADPKGFYYPGEKVVGKLVMRFDQAVQCKKLVFMFKGEATAEWVTISENHRVPHKNNEIYFHRIKTLWEALPPDESIIINPGEISHKFDFQLPNNLPPTAGSHSFSSDVSGHVSYTIQVILVSKKGKLESTTNANTLMDLQVSGDLPK